MKSLHVLEEDLIRAIQEENLDYIKNLVRQGVNIHAWNDYAITMACRVEKLDMIDYFLEQGLDINTENGGPVRTVLMKKNLELLDYLLQNGAILNVKELKTVTVDKSILKWLKEKENDQIKGIPINKTIIKKQKELVGLKENTQLDQPVNNSKKQEKVLVETKADHFNKKLRSLL